MKQKSDVKSDDGARHGYIRATPKATGRTPKGEKPDCLSVKKSRGPEIGVNDGDKIPLSGAEKKVPGEH